MVPISKPKTGQHLQPLNGEGFHHKSANTDENSRLDIRARGFWNRGQDAYFDVRVCDNIVNG